MTRAMTDIDQAPPTQTAPTGWERDGDHALRHPSGWTIARYKVDDVPMYLLWSPVGPVDKYGPFGSAEAAKRRHAELTGAIDGANNGADDGKVGNGGREAGNAGDASHG